MAFQEVKTSETFRLQNFEGRPIIGYYLGRVDSTGEYGVNPRHEFFSEEKNEKFSFWGVTDFDRKLKNVRPGTLVKFTYLGKEMRKVKNGMKEMHSVKVESDPAKVLKDFESMAPKQEEKPKKAEPPKTDTDNLEEVPF